MCRLRGLGSSPFCPDTLSPPPPFWTPPPHPGWSQLSTRLEQGPALSPDASYLPAHLWTNGQPAGSWSPCLGGRPPLRPVSGSLGWSPRWGVSRWRRPSPAPPRGLQTPEQGGLDIPFPGTGISSYPTPIADLHGRPQGMGEACNCHSAAQMKKLRLGGG